MASPKYIYLFSHEQKTELYYLQNTYIVHAYFLWKQFAIFVCNKDFIRALCAESRYSQTSSLCTSNFRSFTGNQQHNVISFVKRNICGFLWSPSWVYSQASNFKSVTDFYGTRCERNSIGWSPNSVLVSRNMQHQLLAPYFWRFLGTKMICGHIIGFGKFLRFL